MHNTIAIGNSTATLFLQNEPIYRVDPDFPHRSIKNIMARKVEAISAIKAA